MTTRTARTTLALWAGAPGVAALLVAAAVVTGHVLVVASGVLLFATCVKPITVRLQGFEDDDAGRTATLWSPDAVAWVARSAGWSAARCTRAVHLGLGLYLLAVTAFLGRLALLALV